MPKYKVAVIGSTGRGNYGHGLDAVWKTLENCEVVAVADDNEAGRTAAQPRTGAARTYANYREMLEKERPQIVAVCPRWTDQHKEMALACAEFGCHMYMEKPFCRTLGEADEIIQACEMRHLKLAVAHISRYSPQLRLIQQLIKGGEIGELLEIRARGKEDARGGGEDLWVLGTHVLDIMRAIAAEPTSCFSTLREKGALVTKEHVKPGNEGLGPLAGDQVAVEYAFPRGVVGYFNSQKGAAGTPSRFGLRIFGSKGIIDHTSGFGNPAYLLKDSSWAGRTSAAKWQTITSQGVDVPETLTTFDYAAGNPAVANDLIAAIEKDRQPLCSMYEARGAIEMVLAAFESHRVRQPITMPLQNKGNPLADLK